MKHLLRFILRAIYYISRVTEKFIFKGLDYGAQNKKSMLSDKDIRDLISSLDEQIEYFRKNKLNQLPVGKVWQQRLIKNIEILKSRPELIHKFNKLSLNWIGDNAECRANLIADINPHNRATKYYYHHLFNALTENHSSAIGLLKKYPADSIGERGVYKKNEFVISVNYLYQLERLAIFKERIEGELAQNFVSSDIGCNAGVYSLLMKKEYPDASFVLVDLPEQLIYAHYYLKSMFNNAKIAAFSHIKDLEVINRSFIKSFDFVLVPSYLAERLQKGSIDVVTSFGSMGEMSREWFNYYLNCEFFKHTQLFFHQDRIHKDYGYGYAITILDYPHSDFETILFEVSPLFQYMYTVDGNIPLFVKKSYHQPLFNFVGRRKHAG